MTRPTHRLALRGAVVAGVAAVLSVSLSPTVAHAKQPNDEPRVDLLAPATLAKQQLSWHDCSLPDVSPATAARILERAPGTKCATITVPRDWDNARDGNTISIEFSKAPASNPAARKGIMLLNPGGPGGQGVTWGPYMHAIQPDLAAAYDTIGFDPRGVGQSTQLNCTYKNTGTTQVEQARDYAQGCLANPLTPFITSRQTAMDMDFIRYLLGEKKTSYVGFSYGTWLGATYASMFPSKADRFLLDSSMDVTGPSMEGTWDLQPISRDRQFQDMMLPWIARHNDVYGLGTDPMEIRKAFEKAGGFDNMANIILGANTIIQAMYTTSRYPQAAATLALIIKNGDGKREDYRSPYTASGRWWWGQALPKMRTQLAAMSVDDETRAAVAAALDQADASYRKNAAIVNGQTAPEYTTENGVFNAIRCNDGQWNRSVPVWIAKLSWQWRNAPLTSQFQSIPACAFWPAQDHGFAWTKLNKIPGLLFIQGEFDAATPYEGAIRSIRAYGQARSIVIDNEGSHGHFPYGTDCVDKPTVAWLVDGQLPRAKYTPCQAVALPGDNGIVYQVGGTVSKRGDIRNLPLISRSQAEANRIVGELRRSQGIGLFPPAAPGTPQVAALPVGS